MHGSWSTAAALVVTFASANASAQITKIVATGDPGGDVGTITSPTAPSLGEEGSVAFSAGAGDQCVLLVARAGTFLCVVKLGQALPGGATFVGTDFGVDPAVPITGPWLAFTGTTTTGGAVLGWQDGLLKLLAGQGATKPGGGALGAINPNQATNTNGETLVFEQSGHLWLVTSSGALTSVFGVGEAVPGLAGHAGKVWSQYPQLDDKGEVSFTVLAESSGSSRWVVLHGPPGNLMLDEPLGIAGDWKAREVFSNSDGVVAYALQADLNATTPWTAIWSGSPGATTQAIKFPVNVDGVTIKDAVDSPIVIAKGGSFVFKGYIDDPKDPLASRMALVRVDKSKPPRLIVAEGAPNPGNPDVVVHQIDNYALAEDGDVYVGLKYKDPVTSANPGQGVFVLSGFSGQKILATGDLVDLGAVHKEKAVESVGFAQNRGAGYARGLNSGGQIVMEMTFDGDTQSSAIVTHGAPVVGATDLGVSIKADWMVPASGEMSNEFTVENLGKVEASTVHLEINTPREWSGVTPDDLSGFKCQATEGTFFSCAGGPLAPGATLTLTLGAVMAVQPGDEVPITAKVLAPGQADANPANNQATGTIKTFFENDPPSSGCCGVVGRRPAGPPSAAWMALIALSVLGLRRSRRRE